MTWSRHPEYKPAATEYLKELPAHWQETKFSRYIAINSGQVDPRSDAYRDMSLVAPNHIEPGTGRLLGLQSADEQAAESGKYLVRKGQVIYSKIRPNLVKAVIAPTDCLCSADMYGLTPDSRHLSSSFTHYMLLSKPFTDYVIDSSMRVAMPKVNHESLGAAPIWLPPLEEQNLIAGFLDAETAKIDALMTKQEQLIATLREDRTATITHAVTKGLDASVEMKETGVPWLGQVPEHWSVPQLGMLAAIGNGSTPSRDEPRYWSGGTVPWLNSSHVNREQITDADQFITEAALMECHLPMVKQGSVLVGLTGQGKTRGMASLLTIRSTINQHLAYISPIDGQLDMRFLQRVLASAYGLLRELSDENGSTKGGLTCSALRKVRVPLPPVVEQIGIVDYLDSRCASLDALIAKAGQVISTLQEYRSALITDAVTGKIDVRGVA